MVRYQNHDTVSSSNHPSLPCVRRFVNSLSFHHFGIRDDWAWRLLFKGAGRTSLPPRSPPQERHHGRQEELKGEGSSAQVRFVEEGVEHQGWRYGREAEGLSKSVERCSLM